jgi:hypothetical protein
MALRKLTGCKHLDKNLEIKSKGKFEGDGYGGTNEWAWTVLACKVCGQESETELTQANHGGHQFGKCYEEVTGRKWDTPDDKTMIALLKDNPELFWKFPPPQAKYLADRVPAQRKVQDELDEAEKQRAQVLRELRMVEVKINKLCAKAGRPAPYLGRYYR